MFGRVFRQRGLQFSPSAVENLTDEHLYKQDFARRIKLAAGSTEIEIPVEAAANFGLTFMAANEISATLYNDKGEIVGKNLTKTIEASAWFRSIFVDKNVAAERGN